MLGRWRNEWARTASALAMVAVTPMAASTQPLTSAAPSPTSAQAQASAAPAQTPAQTAAPTPTIDTLVEEIRRLQREISLLQTELRESRGRAAEVESSLQALREALAEEHAVLEAQLSTLEQSKVESGSKYRARLFGMALMQLVSARGAVDNIDLPILAVESEPGDSGGNISAAVRQSYLGVAVYGPSFLGLDVSADLRVDFFGGFPDVNDGLSAPGVRLRTMMLSAESPELSVRAGQEAPFFSPLSPTSLASTAYPALSSSGNIWAWTPQVYGERRFTRADNSTLVVQAGVLDALTGEVPAGEYSRLPTAGERSRAPAMAGRVAWRRQPDAAQPTATRSIGGGAYYAKQNWSFGRIVNAWAVTADGEWMLTPRLGVSGEFYRGHAIGGLGGGTHSSVLFEGAPTDAQSVVHPLYSTGGWLQLAFQHTPWLAYHVAVGGDGSRPQPFAGLLEPPSHEVPSAQRNASAFGNVIYQARSNLWFTAEYRRLWTTRLDGRGWLADHVSLGCGIAF